MQIGNRRGITLTLGLLPVLVSLLNTGLFGTQSLTSYLGFTIFALGAATAVFLYISCIGNREHIFLPQHVCIFLLLSCYVVFSGLISHNMNLTSYYWATAGLWLITMVILQPKDSQIISRSIALIATIESIVVLLQLIGFLPSKNILFRCTGTWENPNVTAMFLAMAVHAHFQTIKGARKKGIPYLILLLNISAILGLKCRSAYIVTMIFAGSYYLPLIYTSATGRIKNGINRFQSAAIALLLLLTIIMLACLFKQKSAGARLQIWENSIQLMGQKPFAGNGFGSFEKYYNLYIGDHPRMGNDHINMPYNDFLELGVEGGLPAMLLWVMFFISSFFYKPANIWDKSPLMAFLVIELTNFGFQAIPVFALFLLYISALQVESIVTPSATTAENISWGKFSLSVRSLAMLLLIPSFFLLLHQLQLASSLYDQSRARKDPISQVRIASLIHLNPILGDLPSYHQTLGDAYLHSANYNLALSQYLESLQSCTRPEILERAGYCYLQLKRYDSCIHYYTVLRNIQPFRFKPRFDLLNAYQQLGDSVRMISEANEIIKMPVKIESEGVTKIKAYAMHILNR